jgi:hypothetical protein
VSEVNKINWTASEAHAILASQDANDLASARAGFLAASVAVWRETGRLASRPEGYHPTAMDVELRKRERAAWERYRDLLDRAP